MSLLESFETEDKGVEKALSVPIGAASPLWWAFAGVASAGVAYWWMTRWTRPFNIEAETPLPLVTPALLEAVQAIEVQSEAAQVAIETTVETVTEAVETAVEATAEIVEAVVDVQTDTVVEMLEAAPEPEQIVEAAAAIADDLTQLVGVGPKLAVALAERGVTSFEQIAAWGEMELAHFDRELSLKGRAARDAWVAQAKRFSATPVALPE